ncbi:MAG: Rpn family recombination-promoting nuclease/putative transposase [Acidaminococcaceae bacterium]|nr:Rpn family recombination-promoting nuclease/putative transposase [Acidaminococcaceae bacterium]MBQ7418773.1 Rpn family recombination-promoting nuclease/putative transposase [Acidaminococcaceae bacterium]
MKKVFKVEDLNRMNDVFAKYIFANEERKKLTLGLINSFFDFEGTAEIIDLAFKDREIDPDREEGKGAVLDVLGECSDGTLVNVEIQLEQFEEMGRRSLYYWAKLYQRRLLKGEDYETLFRTVTINILDYALFPDAEWKDYHSCFSVLNTKDLHHALTKDLEIHFVELPKWHYKKGAKMKRLERWLAYLSSKTTMEEREALAMVDEDIRTAMEAEKEFVQDYEYMSAYDRREKYLRDQRAHEKFVRNEGVAEGKAEAKKELIIAWRNKGKPDSEIAELLDMGVDEVRQVK